MRSKLVLIACVICPSVSGQQIDKQYVLQGIDDSLRYPIVIQDDLINGSTTFSTQGKAELKVFSVQDVQHVTIHANSFLEVEFTCRGGSGVKVRRNILLCVSQGKIYKTMDILSNVSSRVTEVYDRVSDSLKRFDEKEDYLVTLSVKEVGYSYSLNLFENGIVESKHDPSRNGSFEKNYELYFDPSGYFFYNSTRRLSSRYRLYSPENSDGTVEKFISEEVPTIELHEKVYLLIDNRWYFDNGNGFLSLL